MLERAVLQQSREQQVAHLEQRQILLVVHITGRQQTRGLEVEQCGSNHQKVVVSSSSSFGPISRV